MGRKSRRKGKSGGSEASSGSGTTPGRAIAIAAVVCVAAVLVFQNWRSAPTPEPVPPSTPRATPRAPVERPEPPDAESGGVAPTQGAEDTPERYRPLLGEWLRPDGGYVLSVAAIDAEGAARVRYLNPRPINVGRAEAREEGEAVGLFVELRDRNYPGSTYTLAYDAEGDQLVGVYYQALQRASFDVVFVRKR